MRSLLYGVGPLRRRPPSILLLDSLLPSFSTTLRHVLPPPSLQVDDHRHILLSPKYLESINHSCTPNVFFNTTTFQLECLRPISIGDELSFFYPSTEWEMDAPFK